MKVSMSTGSKFKADVVFSLTLAGRVNSNYHSKRCEIYKLPQLLNCANIPCCLLHDNATFSCIPCVIYSDLKMSRAQNTKPQADIGHYVLCSNPSKFKVAVIFAASGQPPPLFLSTTTSKTEDPLLGLTRVIKRSLSILKGCSIGLGSLDLPPILLPGTFVVSDQPVKYKSSIRGPAYWSHEAAKSYTALRTLMFNQVEKESRAANMISIISDLSSKVEDLTEHTSSTSKQLVATHKQVTHLASKSATLMEEKPHLVSEKSRLSGERVDLAAHLGRVFNRNNTRAVCMQASKSNATSVSDESNMYFDEEESNRLATAIFQATQTAIPGTQMSTHTKALVTCLQNGNLFGRHGEEAFQSVTHSKAQ